MSTAKEMMRNIDDKLTTLVLQSRFQIVALVGITLLAAFLRFYRLGEWSFWIDEMRTIGRAQAHYSNLETTLQNIPPNTNWIPLSVILVGATLQALGVSEWSARLAPALIGIVSLPIFYFPIRRLLGTSVALIAVTLLAVSPWHIYWSQNARFYTAVLLFYSLALFAFFFGIERDRPAYLVIFVGLTYLAASERLLALLIMPVVVSYLVLVKLLPFEKPPGLRARNLILILLPLIIGGGIELVSVVTQDTSRFFSDFVFWGNSIENPLGQAIFIVLELGIPIVILAIFCGLYLVLQRNRIGLFLFLGALVPFGLVILLTPFMFTEERYAFVTMVSWVVLAGVAVKEVGAQAKGFGRYMAIGLLALFVADAAAANLMYFRVNNGNRRDYKGAFALVQERSRESDLVVSTWPELGEYYLNREVVSWQDVEPETIVQGDRRVWFVIVPDMAWVWENEDVYWWVSHNSELIQVKYLRRPDDANLFVYLYSPAPK